MHAEAAVVLPRGKQVHTAEVAQVYCLVRWEADLEQWPRLFLKTAAGKVSCACTSNQNMLITMQLKNANVRGDLRICHLLRLRNPVVPQQQDKCR